MCHSRGTVPSIYGLPIDMARRMLAKSGWKPVDMSAAGTRSPGWQRLLPNMASSRSRIVWEQAWAFCLYKYEGPAGRLVVTTAGEIEADGTMPSVVGLRA